MNDMKKVQILLYGSEVLGQHQNDEIETIDTLAYNRYPDVKSLTSNKKTVKEVSLIHDN